jgi:transcriptional regulator with XRE-family HTH domain
MFEQNIAKFSFSKSNHEKKGTDQVSNKFSIGTQLKTIRTNNNLTLEQTSKYTGLARSTLSKIENERISPTFSVLQKLAAGLGIEIPQLFTTVNEHQSTGRRDITLQGAGELHRTSTYDHRLLATQISNKKMTLSNTRVHARSFNDFGEWVRHEGEEFLFVIEGEIQLLTEFYQATTLTQGDSVYYDASMGHVVISISEEDEIILWISAE